MFLRGIFFPCLTHLSPDLPTAFVPSIMGVFRTLLLSASAASAASATCIAAANASTQLSDPAQACALLKQNHPNITLLPEDDGYKGENEGTSA